MHTNTDRQAGRQEDSHPGRQTESDRQAGRQTHILTNTLIRTVSSDDGEGSKICMATC